MKTTTKYEKAILEMCTEFARRHEYCMHEPVTADDFVSCEIGDILMLNDEFWSVQDIYTALKLDIPTDMLHDWYYSEVDKALAGIEPRINLKNYFLLNKK